MSKKKILIDLHLCLAGYGGIPQDARIIYAMLSELESLETAGLLISRGLFHREDFAYKKLSFIGKIWIVLKFLFSFQFVCKRHNLSLWKKNKEEIWRAVFEKSIAFEKKENVLRGPFYKTKVGFLFLKLSALFSLPLIRLDMKGWDYFLSHIGFPAKLSSQTQMLVRFHDLIPLTHPEFFPDGFVYKRAFQKQLEANIKNAIFICNSETTRENLLAHAPKLSGRAYVVHCCVSDAFFPENSCEIPKILKANAHALFYDEGQWKVRAKKNLNLARKQRYFLVVNTLEPRKNYRLLLEMWKRYRKQFDADIKLVFVANIGWKVDEELALLAPFVEDGSIVFLQKVPFADLRALYTHAIATISPSLVEGFSLGGIEAMKCASPVLASDIKVHQEIYQDAPFYFDPSSKEELFEAMQETLNLTEKERQTKIRAGFKVAELYNWENVKSQWKALFEQLKAT